MDIPSRKLKGGNDKLGIPACKIKLGKHQKTLLDSALGTQPCIKDFQQRVYGKVCHL